MGFISRTQSITIGRNMKEGKIVDVCYSQQESFYIPSHSLGPTILLAYGISLAYLLVDITHILTA